MTQPIPPPARPDLSQTFESPPHAERKTPRRTSLSETRKFQRLRETLLREHHRDLQSQTPQPFKINTTERFRWTKFFASRAYQIVMIFFHWKDREIERVWPPSGMVPIV